MSLVLRAGAVGMGALVVALAAGCSSRVESCAELGSDWQECTGVSPLVCVHKTDTKSCNQVRPGSSDAGSTTARPDATASCSAPAPDRCTSGCTSIATDPQNCGRCSNKCEASELCVEGVCQ